MTGGKEKLTAQGDVFSVYFLEYRELLVNYFRKRGFGDDSQDLAQETFLKAYQKLPDLRKQSSFKFWLLTIAKRTLLNKIRDKASSRVEVFLSQVTFDDFLERAHAPVEDRADNPLNSLLEEEGTERLAGAFKQLPHQMRHCIYLRVYQNLKYREIAGVMQLELNTVKSHIFQAKQKLKELLTDHEDDLE